MARSRRALEWDDLRHQRLDPHTNIEDAQDLNVFPPPDTGAEGLALVVNALKFQ